ncbi:MAG: S8 family serine peptidase, partial [Actinomycetota bacterium]
MSSTAMWVGSMRHPAVRRMGVRWGLFLSSPRMLAHAALLGVALLSFHPITAADRAASSPVSVVVQADTAAVAAVAVRRAGGTVTRSFQAVGGVAATVPASAVDSIARANGVRAVTPDVTLQAQSESYDPDLDPTSVSTITRDVTSGAAFWRKGFDGSGVDVALIDTGVTPVPGLDDPERLRFGPDLSFESQQDGLRHLDTYGHGTHLAGIIAAKDRPVSGKPAIVGMAPGSRLVSLKVADATGAADVSQVIAAIDWVVQHRNTDGLNIRVLNLAFSTDSTQSYLLDPLAHAAEVAWRRGVVVVVAAGNSGGTRSGLGNPAIDPYVIAVGAATDADGKRGFQDASVMSWSARGNGTRNPDLVASGKSIASLRVPGSYIDTNNPTARVGDRFFRGSGTSQAAAVVSGAAALIVQQRPGISPDQVKALLMGTAAAVPGAGPVEAGAGMIDLRATVERWTPSTSQSHQTSQGTGSLEGARGSMHVSSGGVSLTGEQD